MLTACSSPVPLTVTELGREAPQLPQGEATEINDAGRIVGWSRSQAVEFLTDGKFVLLSIPAGFSACTAVAIANDGTIVGNCTRSSSNRILSRIHVWDASRVERELLALPGDAVDNAVDMNERGVILQSDGAADPGWWTHDLRSGKRTQVPSPPGSQISAAAINDVGDIVGTSRLLPSGPPLPVKWSGDLLVMTTLATPPGCNGAAVSINNHGVIVGYTRCGAGAPTTPVVWPAATALPVALPLTPPVVGHLSLTAAHGINDAGIVIGEGAYFFDDLAFTKGLAWMPDRQIIDLGNGVRPMAINASGVIVGGLQEATPVKIQF